MGKQEQAEKDYLSGMSTRTLPLSMTCPLIRLNRGRNVMVGNVVLKRAHPPEKRVHTKVKKGAHKNEGTNDELNTQTGVILPISWSKTIAVVSGVYDRVRGE